MSNRPAVRAFAPANISLVFETYDAEPPHGRGSLGVGITLTEGVTVRASLHDGPHTVIRVHGEEWAFPTVRAVADELAPRPVLLEIDAGFEFGCGFGMSGASALAATLALDRLFALGMSREALGMVAHRAEVANSTGLGDVGGQYNGGIMIKTWKHRPLTVQQLPVAPQTLHCRIYGPIATAEVITSPDMLREINRAGHAALTEISGAEHLDMARLFEISRNFAVGSGLVRPTVERSIREAESAGHRASMIMLGEAVVATGPFPGSSPVEISFEGARLLPDS